MGVDRMEPCHGVAISQLQTTRELAKRGHEIAIAYLQDGPFVAEYKEFADRVVQVPQYRVPPLKPWQLAAFLRGIAWTTRWRPDVVYDHALWSLPWSVTAAALSRVPVIAHMHGYIDGGPGRQERILMKRAVSKFVAVSDFVAGQLIDAGIHASRVTVAHNGIDPDVYRPAAGDEATAARRALGLRPESFVVLFLGRNDPSKGLDVLLRAVAMSQHRDDIDVAIVGPDDTNYRARLQTEAAGLRCHWLPQRGDVLTPLHAADVVVLPAQWEEPFGRVVIEAMATGRPAVASHSGGLPEILTGEFARYLFPRTDPSALAACLDSVWQWRTTQPGLTKRCRAHVVEKFNIETMIDRIEQALLSAADKNTDPITSRAASATATRT
jgi:glycosyltransferase involved in cell wall biosynthesis